MSFIVDKFLALLAGVHEEKIPQIHSHLDENGFVLSIDGTVSIGVVPTLVPSIELFIIITTRFK